MAPQNFPFVHYITIKQVILLTYAISNTELLENQLITHAPLAHILFYAKSKRHSKQKQFEKTTYKMSKVQVVFQGVLGAYSHQAIMELLGNSNKVNCTGLETFEACFEAVSSGKADYAMVGQKKKKNNLFLKTYFLFF